MSYKAYPWGRWIKWVVFGLLIIILLTSSVSTYNGLVSAEQDVESNWSQVENVMQRRADVIINLVEVVKGYTKHEEKVFGDIAAARSILMNNEEDVNSKILADETIKNAARDVLLLVENYPDLKASEQFTNLQVAIESAENRVSVERERFIRTVQTYNTKIKRFPGSIFARIMGFEPKDYFKAGESAKESPKVNFD
jgi:LemA protein